MTTDDTRTKVAECITKLVADDQDCDPAAVSEAMKLAEIDSLGQIQILLAVEEEFEIDILLSREEAVACVTLADAIDLVVTRVNAK